MSEIRQDHTTEEWVIMARERAKRPHEFVCQQAEPKQLAFSLFCPFCPGNEAMTQPETLSYRDQKTGWPSAITTIPADAYILTCLTTNSRQASE
ncbi:MAG: hypothetical protein GQ507_02700 [Dehalococcoidales bacterium]|nr:hypothetical protein [Dehalococcoidales bacterium]